MPRCADEYCPQWVYAAEQGEAVGWQVIGERLFCALHAPEAALAARQQASRARLEAANAARRAFRSEQVARKTFTAAEYRAWDQFQADLADYHRKTGKLAARELRMWTPAMWVQEYNVVGRIDVAATTANLQRGPGGGLR